MEMVPSPLSWLTAQPTHQTMMYMNTFMLLLDLDLDTGSIIDPYQDLIIIINTHMCVIHKYINSSVGTTL